MPRKGNPDQGVVGESGMLLYLGVLGVGERSGLVQDIVRDTELVCVVQRTPLRNAHDDIGSTIF